LALIGNGRIARYQRRSTPVTKASFSRSVNLVKLDPPRADQRIDDGWWRIDDGGRWIDESTAAGGGRRRRVADR
jgi:hypothetical protein